MFLYLIFLFLLLNEIIKNQTNVNLGKTNFKYYKTSVHFVEMCDWNTKFKSYFVHKNLLISVENYS